MPYAALCPLRLVFRVIILLAVWLCLPLETAVAAKRKDSRPFAAEEEPLAQGLKESPGDRGLLWRLFLLKVRQAGDSVDIFDHAAILREILELEERHQLSEDAQLGPDKGWMALIRAKYAAGLSSRRQRAAEFEAARDIFLQWENATAPSGSSEPSMPPEYRWLRNLLDLAAQSRFSYERDNLRAEAARFCASFPAPAFDTPGAAAATGLTLLDCALAAPATERAGVLQLAHSLYTDPLTNAVPRPLAASAAALSLEATAHTRLTVGRLLLNLALAVDVDRNKARLAEFRNALEAAQTVLHQEAVEDYASVLQGEQSSAVSILKSGEKSLGNEPLYWLFRARLTDMLAGRHTGEGREYYQKALDLAPDSPMVLRWFALSECAEARNMNAEMAGRAVYFNSRAVLNAERAACIDSDDPTAWLLWDWSFSAISKPGEAPRDERTVLALRAANDRAAELNRRYACPSFLAFVQGRNAWISDIQASCPSGNGTNSEKSGPATHDNSFGQEQDERPGRKEPQVPDAVSFFQKAADSPHSPVLDRLLYGYLGASHVHWAEAESSRSENAGPPRLAELHALREARKHLMAAHQARSSAAQWEDSGVFSLRHSFLPIEQLLQQTLSKLLCSPQEPLTPDLLADARASVLASLPAQDADPARENIIWGQKLAFFARDMSRQPASPRERERSRQLAELALAELTVAAEQISSPFPEESSAIALSTAETLLFRASLEAREGNRLHWLQMAVPLLESIRERAVPQQQSLKLLLECRLLLCREIPEEDIPEQLDNAYTDFCRLHGLPENDGQTRRLFADRLMAEEKLMAESRFRILRERVEALRVKAEE